MLIRSLAVLALLLTPVASPLTVIRPALAQSQQIAVAELMRLLLPPMPPPPPPLPPRPAPRRSPMTRFS